MAAAQQHSPEQTAVFNILNQLLGEEAAGYEADLRWTAAQQLLSEGYTTEVALRGATRQGLREAGVALALVDAILRHSNAGGAAAGRVHVHVLVGKEMEPEYLELLDADGVVSFKPLQEQMIRRCYKLSGIAVVDEPTENPAYQKMVTYNPVLRAGQHVYLRAEPTGKAHWLLDLIAPNVLQRGVSAH